MAITFTPQQQRVIDLKGRNILVSAAAGSGKTAVLVERIVEMVCDDKHPVDIDRLLIVTFTNAAAAEMRERISAGIGARLLANPESEHIQKQSALLHNALITTIDSFSLFLLRNHFNEIGLDPAFRVADEGEIRLLQQDVMKELMEDSYAGGDAAFRSCVEYFCPGGRESVLEQHILNLSRCAASYPWPEEWLKKRREDYGAVSEEDLENSDYGRYLLNHLDKLVSGCIEKLQRVQALCQEPDGPYMYGELTDGELEAAEKLRDCKTLADYAAKLSTVAFGRLPSKKDDTVSPAKRELAKKLRSQVKDTLQTTARLFFATPLSLAAAQGAACREPVETLVELTLSFDRRMRQKKQEKKLVDFSDIEHFALDILIKREGELLKPSAVALEYRQHFHEILIDEYQDSNLVQEYLLKAVSGEEDGCFNRFMVGDVKQSIYKFRLARPELFLEKYDSYEQDGKCTRIDLSKNFRSRSQVVDTVNGLFSRIMSKEIGGIVYDERAALYAGAVYPENPGCGSELILVEKPENQEGRNAKQAEAWAIAAKIKELLEDFQVTDKETGSLRPVRFSDIVILLRTNSGWDEEFKKVLEEEGIPAYVTSKTGYFAAPEVQELLQLLKVLDNPTQDIPLFGVMKSLFGGFEEEEIAKIRSGRKGCSLYGALQNYAKQEEGEGQEKEEDLRRKAAAFLGQIESYRDYTVYLPVRELLQKLVNDFDYLNYVTALPAGSKRRANVEMLLAKASDFEKTSYFGLFHFIRYMEQMEKYDVDYGEADTLDENADVVRIMSIHKSKGLEFPVTFVAGLSKRFNMQDSHQSVVIDMDLGLATDYVDYNRRIRNKTLRRMALARKMREDNLAEELRVLYVALTRAREKLILTASLEQAQEKWELLRENGDRHLTYLDFIEAGSYLDLLLPVAGAPDASLSVTVTDLEKLSGQEVKEQLALHGKADALRHAKEWTDEAALKKLKERLAYTYPYESLEKLYTKTTVSELKIAAMAQRDEAAYHAFEEEEIHPYIPAFRKGEEKVAGALRGSAFHRVMELLDFEGLLGAQFAAFPESFEKYREGLSQEALGSALNDFLMEQAESLRLSAQYLEAVNQEKILRFLQKELAYRMWAASRRGELSVEQPFVLGVEASRLGEQFPEGETVLVQGIIDAFFVEEGQIVLLDYKTDVIRTMEDLWNRYQVQLDYYQEAVEKLTGKRVKEKILYSFYLEKEGVLTEEF